MVMPSMAMSNAGAEASRDNAVVLRDVVSGTYYTFRVFHAGT